eukprot:2686977-Prymnesium_polylepis.1
MRVPIGHDDRGSPIGRECSPIGRMRVPIGHDDRYCSAAMVPRRAERAIGADCAIARLRDCEIA